MEYYLINIISRVTLLFVLIQFIDDFLKFDVKNVTKRIIFSCIWLIDTFLVNELLHIPFINLFTATFLMLLISSTYIGSLIKKTLVCCLISFYVLHAI